MLLHHLAAPGEAIKQLARLVNAGGSLLVTELCSHNQSWAREACGRLCLGIVQDALIRWTDAAGIAPGASLYIGFQKGFKTQARDLYMSITADRTTTPNRKNTA